MIWNKHKFMLELATEIETLPRPNISTAPTTALAHEIEAAYARGHRVGVLDAACLVLDKANG